MSYRPFSDDVVSVSMYLVKTSYLHLWEVMRVVWYSNVIVNVNTICFSAIFTKEATFLSFCLPVWTMRPLRYNVYFFRKKFAPLGAHSFITELDSIE